MQLVLVMFKSENQRRSFSLPKDMTLIGRREDCDLRIPLGDVSRKHCRIIKEGETVRVEDLGSSNGTYINGQRIQEAELQPGDLLKIGPVTFITQIDGLPPEEQMTLPASVAGEAAPPPLPVAGVPEDIATTGKGGPDKVPGTEAEVLDVLNSDDEPVDLEQLMREDLGDRSEAQPDGPRA